MSYTFERGRIYRMPTHFGPAPGPRQRPDGGHYDNSKAPHTLTAWVRWPVAPEVIEPHLPPGFTAPQGPDVLVEMRQRRNLPWLAGRGYNIIGVSFSAVAPNGDHGLLLAVAWESLPDAVLTGREELGIPKLWADVSNLTFDEMRGAARASAEWCDFRFLEINVEDLREDAATERHDIIGEDYFQWRYFPRTGQWGNAEISYPTRTPGAVPDRRVLRSWRGTGRVHINAAQWEDLPTMVHVVNALAVLTPARDCQAGLVETTGNRDLSDQRPLIEVP
jgi:hypothetical protein